MDNKFSKSKEVCMIEGYATVKEMAKRWGLTVRTVQIMCADGKIAGVTKFGNVWAIPVNVEKPTDNRIVSGEYKNWRKRSGEVKKNGNEV